MKQAKGFTLIELMITIAIIGILAGIAVPQYSAYTKRAKYSQVVIATMDRKTAVSICFHESNGFASCNGTRNPEDNVTIPADIATPGYGVIDTITTTQGVITATGTSEVDGKTFVLTPQDVDSEISWSYNGTCLEVQYCR